MQNKWVIVIGSVVIIIIATLLINAHSVVPDKQEILDFIKTNPDRTSIKLVRNDSVLCELNADVTRPLASTVKIILAIEYAEQAASGMLAADAMIPLAEVEKFYVPNTDGGAHPAWKKAVQTEIVEDAISIREIAKGMIKYSSNANTEWLLEKLGAENVNQRIKLIGLKNHSEIYPIVSALFVGKEAFPDQKGSVLQSKLEGISVSDYVATTYRIHEKLKTDTAYKKELGDLGFNIQRVWSDKLPASTVGDYTSILKKINSRRYFKKEVHAYLNEVMEYLMDNPANRTLFAHAGMKGGSTASVLTKALYATDKKGGNTTELAYFFDGLNFFENRQLQLNMNAFEWAILTDKTFREQLATIEK
jgi:D-alanyl-D-alanine carboxypeptidase